MLRVKSRKQTIVKTLEKTSEHKPQIYLKNSVGGGIEFGAEVRGISEPMELNH